jgi:glycogen debranching enzyme
MRQVLKPLDDGRFPNRYPAADLGSADGIGWNATRFLAMLENELSQFEEDELDNLYNLFTEQLEKLEQHYLKDGLIINKSHETWMDTGGEQDPRNGACIEIQLLHHNINRLQSKLAEITGKEDKSKNRLPDIKDAFFDKGRLADRISESGEKDFTARPNLFIAAYLCPALLSKNEWKDVFQWAFDELWLPWGGLSTISKSSTLFQPFYTGQTDESYHRGDSWYWINNISAIALNRICPEDYKEEIEKILKASTREILFSGAPGHHAELSSAFDLRSEGCFAQSWSAATYLELARELF